MTFLVVGLDRTTLAPWHQNVRAADMTGAQRIALGRAAALGVHLVVAAVIGPSANVLPDAAARLPSSA